VAPYSFYESEISKKPSVGKIRLCLHGAVARPRLCGPTTTLSCICECIFDAFLDDLCLVASKIAEKVLKINHMPKAYSEGSREFYHNLAVFA